MDNTYDQGNAPVQIGSDPAPVSQPEVQPWLQTKPAFRQNAAPQSADPRQLEMGRCFKRVKHARSSLLVLLILSAINMLTIPQGANIYWPYCISMPYESTIFVNVVENYFITGGEGMGTLAGVTMVLGFLVLGVYLLCWIFSKKKGSWLLAGAILYTVDSVALVIYVLVVMEGDPEYLLSFGFHVLALVELYMGVMAQKKLKAMQNPQPLNQVHYTGTCDPEKF